MTDREKAIAAYASGILSEKIVIYPKGKRTARLVAGKSIRLYLGNRLWQRGATVDQAREWVE